MLLRKPSRGIDNPALTEEAAESFEDTSIDSVLSDVLESGRLTAEDKMLITEAKLLEDWEDADEWRQYLDTPLIAHCDAALSLQKMGFDAAIGIERKGMPYAHIFEMMGWDIGSVYYSHHREDMIAPLMEPPDAELAREKQKVLLVENDFITGKTIRTVYDHLRRMGINVQGVYCGLTKWPGKKYDVPHVSSDTVDFDKFWRKPPAGLTEMKDQMPYRLMIIPHGLRVFAPNSRLADKPNLGQGAARRIVKYLLAN
ncbi:phosphoribosyltransferase [Candidatus Woesearchaeota archaeon]|nr:phosphoribosyltransferase [Candidatus Woesearchaeota archaeon]